MDAWAAPRTIVVGSNAMIDKRIVVNSAVLYLRVIACSALALLGSRIVLSSLGTVDYGLYSVVLGVMGFMSFLNAAMATSSSRYLTYELGAGDSAELNATFRATVLLHAGVAAVVLLVSETIGLWFLTEILIIPEGRTDAAVYVYQCAVIGALCVILSVPYQALLTAHEALPVVAALSTLQAGLNFTSAYVISLASGDRLVLFAILSSSSMFAVAIFQAVVCARKYEEARLFTENHVTTSRLLELLRFSGWTLVGHLAFVCRMQGVAFLLNIFYGPLVNAAYGIANQVSAMMAQLTQVLQQAITPRLVKQEGAGDRAGMLSLSLISSKSGFCIGCLWGIPIFAELPTLLELWLVEVPEHTVAFCRYGILIFLADQISAGYGLAVLALGELRRYQMTICTIHLLTLPFGYLLLTNDVAPSLVLCASLSTMIVASAVRGMVVQTIAELPYKKWVRVVVARSCLSLIPSLTFAAGITYLVPHSITRVVVTSVGSGIFTLVGVLFVAFEPRERAIIFSTLSHCVLKIAKYYRSHIRGLRNL